MILIISIPIFVLPIIIFLISTPSCYGLYFGHSLIITKDNLSSPLLSYQIAITQKGNAYVVWVDNGTIYFKSSQVNENKFGPKIVLSENNNSASSPRIAATEKGDVYVMWADKNSTTGNSNIVFRSSNDSGESFASMKELSGTNVLSFYPQIAATEKGNVYVVWVDIDSKTGDSNISFRSSNDSGENFTERENIRGGKVLSFSPQITATEKGNVHIVWVDIDSKTGDSNIALKSSNDSGESFAQRKVLRTGKVLSFSPQITATDRGNVYVVWVDKNSTTGDSNIAFRSSNDSGESFDNRVYLNRDKNKLTKSSSPQIAATEKGNVYVVWVEGNIKFRQILDKGIRTGQTISLSNITSTSLSPHMIPTEDGNVYVVWIDKNSTGIGETLLFKRVSELFFDRYS